MATKTKEEIKLLAIAFVAALPKIFGEALDRMTLWPRIGSALRTSFAKAAGDSDLFIASVAEHLCADDGAVARCEEVLSTLVELESWSQPDREAWMLHLYRQTPIVLVFAKASWEGVKKTKKSKPDNPDKVSPARDAANLFLGEEEDGK
jgi:hypothetical protein